MQRWYLQYFYLKLKFDLPNKKIQTIQHIKFWANSHDHYFLVSPFFPVPFPNFSPKVSIAKVEDPVEAGVDLAGPYLNTKRQAILRGHLRHCGRRLAGGRLEWIDSNRSNFT